jgi:glycosyltransferase involved in cell wall biosynthesis
VTTERSVGTGGSGPAPIEAQVSWRPLHIAMVGQKGLPATYGGIEHVVSETGRRLADRGHTVTVFTRTSYAAVPESPYLGMNVVPAFTIASKHLDAIVHSATSTAKALTTHRCDVVHYHALGPGLMAPLPRYLSRSKVVLTVHGLDHERSKWGSRAQSVLRLAHWVSGHVPDRTLVVSETLRRHYADTFGRDAEHVPNGVDLPEHVPASAIADLGLEPGRYVLFVGRIVPEKWPDKLIEAFRSVDRDVRLAVVGDSSWTDEFTTSVRELAARDPRVVLAGYQFGERLSALYEHAGGFVQPSLVEGLPLTLLEAVSHGLPVLVSDIPPHLEVVAPEGSDLAGATDDGGSPCRADRPGATDAAVVTFAAGDVDDLVRGLTTLVDRFPVSRVAAAALRERTLGRYDWDAATDRLEQVYLELAAGIPPTLSREAQLARSLAPSRAGTRASRRAAPTGSALRAADAVGEGAVAP